MNKKVLIVDDSVFIHREMKNLLSDTEFEVVGCAKTGEESFELYNSLHPDIVTMDIILPGIDGFESAKIILKNWPEAKIVMVSSLAYGDTFESAKELGSCGFVAKPFDRDELLTSLRLILKPATDA